MKREKKVFFNLDAEEFIRIEQQKGFIPRVYYEESGLGEWGKIESPRTITRFFVIRPERLSEETLKEDAIV
jgi:hypothetical protein